MKVLAVVVAMLAFAAPAHAAPQFVKLGDFKQPLYVASPPGDPSRLFVVEKAGAVRLMINGAVQATPFLDLTSSTISADEERGLLSMAFAPDYATSGVFYVYRTRQPDGALEITSFRRSAGNPNVADPASGQTLLTIPHSDAANHNGGQLQFGPDGKLYAGTGDGDGGGANDQYHHAEDPGSLLGKLIRFDASGPVVVARGLRNPWRFSFDRQTGQIVIGDVGQGAWEEVDVGFGSDYGWPCFEGTHSTGSAVASCQSATTMPVLERSHDTGYCAIVGGYVVRDAGLPTLNGRYLYGDNCSNDVRSFDLANPGADASTGLTVDGLTSFGEDSCGHVYAASLSGPVYQLVDGAPSACSAPAAPSVPAPTLPACAVTFGVTGLHSVARRHRLSVAVKANRDCPVTISAAIRGVAHFRTVKATIGTTRRVLALRLTKRGLAAVRKRLRRHRVLTVTLHEGGVVRRYRIKG